LKYFIFLFIVSLFSCTSKNTDNISNTSLRNEKDSLIVMKGIIAIMRKENFLKMPQFDSYFSCVLPPREGNILEITTDSTGNLWINSTLDNDGVFNSTILFYSVNREKNVDYNYPYFSRITKKEIKKNLFDAKEVLIEVQNVENIFVDIITFKEHVVNEWNKKWRAITVLRKNTLIEPSNIAYISLEQDTPYNPKINSSVYTAYYQLRNELCIKYFNESYFTIFKRNVLKPNLIDNERLTALTYLQPIAFYDREELKRKGLESSVKYVWGIPFEIPPPIEMK